MSSAVFACVGQSCLGQRAMSLSRWHFFPSLCQSRAPRWHFSPPNLLCAPSPQIDVASLKTVCNLTCHSKLFSIKFWRINVFTFNALNSWIIRSPWLEQYGAVQSTPTFLSRPAICLRPSNAESAVISKITLPVRARHRADKTNSFHEEEKLDGGSERQFAAHLKAAIKVLENYREEWCRQKLFCHCGGNLWQWKNSELCRNGEN